MSHLRDLYEGLTRILNLVDEGRLPIVKIWEMGCHVHYTFANGVILRVFNDAGDWDYIDAMQADDGLWVKLWEQDEPPEDTEALQVLIYWHPSSDRLETIWHWSRVVVGGETMSPAPD